MTNKRRDNKKLKPFRNAWEFLVNVVQNIWRYIEKPLERGFAFSFVAIIIAGAWYGFLAIAIVATPPIATTPAFVMVWGSVAVLIFALFPGIFDRIKKIKLKDFELELEEIVTKASSSDFITFSDIEGSQEEILGVKGTFKKLIELFERAIMFPDEPVLLVVNLGDGLRVTITMLFIYLFFLNLFGSSVKVLFVSSENKIKNYYQVKREEIVGAVSGTKVLQRFLKLFPGFSSILKFKFTITTNNQVTEPPNNQVTELLTLKNFPGVYKSNTTWLESNLKEVHKILLEEIRNTNNVFYRNK